MQRKKNHLKLIEGGQKDTTKENPTQEVKAAKKEETPSKRNFWNTCSRKLDHLPEHKCSMGEQSMQNPKSPQCEWAINSEEHSYCFWKYIWDNSNPNGEMGVTSVSKLGKLLGITPTRIPLITKKAIKKMKITQKFKDFE